jgi:hypothetical protein
MLRFHTKVDPRKRPWRLIGLRDTRHPTFLDNLLTDGGEVVSLTHRRRALLPINIIFLLLVLISVRLSKPQGLVRPEGLGKLKTIHSRHRVLNLRPSSLHHSAQHFNVYLITFCYPSQHWRQMFIALLLRISNFQLWYAIYS